MTRTIEKNTRTKRKAGNSTDIRLRGAIRDELHNSERRMEKRIKRAVDQAVTKREQMALLMFRGKSNMVERDGIGQGDVRNIAKMVRELYERLSGTSSDVGEEYTFRNGKDARLLLDVQEELRKSKPIITPEEAGAVSLIYKRFFPDRE